MGSYIDLERWARRAHFQMFLAYDRPYFSLTTEVEVTGLYAASRHPDGPSFFLGVLFAAMHAANSVEAFRLRIRDAGVWRHDRVGIGCTVLRGDRSFGFGYFPHTPSLAEFQVRGRMELERVRSLVELDARDDDGWLHGSVLPWTRFTGVTNALRKGDSVPKLIFGQRFLRDARWYLPVGVEAHHALVDGLDVGEFLQEFQERVSGPSSGGSRATPDPE